MISVLIPTRNRPDLLKQCVESLLVALDGIKVSNLVVWDNGDDDETKIVTGLNRMKRLSTGQNESYSRSMNLSSQQAKGDLLLLNNDVFLTPGCINSMVRALKEGCEVVGAKLLYPQGTVQHYGVGFSRDYMPFHIGRYEAADSPWCSIDRVVAATTFACVLIKRTLWETLGGLDEEYFYSFEDIDFCLRAREIGAVVGIVHDAMAVHLEAQTQGRSDNDARNWEVFAKKWLNTGRIYAALGVWPQWIRE